VLALAGATRASRLLARILSGGFILLLLALWFLPWQQYVTGTGKIIAFDPLDRRVNVEAAVSGLVRKLHVVEGQRIEKGAILAELQDNDPNLISNLTLQRDAQIARQAAAQQRVDDLSFQITQQEQAKSQAVAAAEQRLAAEKITAETARLNFERISSLRGPGLVSQRDFEMAKLLKESSSANLSAAEATLLRTGNEYDATIAGIRAQRGTAQAEVATAQRDITAAEVQLSQSRRQTVEAPRTGIVLSVAVTDGTYLRPGSPICVLIPETENRFVEMWLNGNDVPLVQPRHQEADGTISPGSDVRLQFEGWPAVQFVGWPSVAVGTFGGEVVFVDAADDGKGRFRIVIAPKPDVVRRGGKEVVEQWPGNRWLRQGVRAKGWVLLKQVPLWKEVWRRANGFPPIVADQEPGAGGGAKK
jgi:multidrug resistance efflux pump